MSAARTRSRPPSARSAAGNYSFTFANGQLTVSKATLTVTASSPANGVYGAAVPAISAGYSGFELGEGPSDLDTAPSCTTDYVVGDGPAVYTTSCSGGMSDNYAFVYVDGTFTVGKATLTVTATSPANGEYGAAKPAISAGYRGFVLGEGPSDVDTAPSCTTDYVVGDGPAVYTTSCSGGVSDNYAFVYVDGTFTVGKATLTVTATSPANGVYGAAVPAISAGYSGFVLGEGPSDLDTAPSCTTDYVVGDGLAVYTTSCSGGVSDNYAFVYVDGTFTVGKATLTVTASSPANGVYGAAEPAISAGYSGFDLGEGPSDLDTAPSCTTDYVVGDGPAVYTTSCSGGESDNYAIVDVDGTFTVGKATLTVTASSPANGVYGAAVPAISAGYSGFVLGEGPSDLDTAPSCTTDYVVGDGPAVYTTSCSGGVSDNYAFVYVDGTFTVGKATLTVTASSPANGVYGAAVPAISAGYSGFVLGEGPSDLDTAPSCTTDYVVGDGPAVYTTSCSGGVSDNYAFVYVDGTFTVGKATLTVTASSPANGVYGAAVPAISAGYSGFVLGEGPSDLDTAPSCTTDYVVGDGPAVYTTSCSGGVSDNYAFVYVDGTFTVGKATLTVTASSPANGVYGAAVPAISAGYSGFVLGEGPSDLDTAPSCTTDYVVGDGPAVYTTSCSGGVSDNYAFVYVDGTFTVGKATLTVTASSPANGVYGAAVPAISAGYSGFVLGEGPSDLDTAPSCTTDYVVGDGPAVYTTSCSGGVSDNYAFVYVDGTFTVGKATLTVTASSPANGVYGAAVPAISAGYSGFVLGEGPSDLDTAPSCTTDYVVGDGPAVYTTSCSGGVSDNYAFVYVDGTFTVGKATLTVTASSPANGVYGAAVPAISAGYSGFVLGEGPSDLDTAPSCTTDYVVGDGPAVYTTSCSGGVSDNYAFVYVDGTFTVGKATLTVTASSPANGVYGAAVPAISAGYSGFVLGEGPSDLDTAPSCTTDYVVGDGPAVYTTSCSGGVSDNYAFVYVDGTFTVGKATLTVTASSPADGVYGAAVPAISAGYSGFVLGEGPSDLDTAPSCTTDYVVGDGPAVYTTSCSGGVSDNYAFVYVDGTFTVGKATPTCTVTAYSVPFDTFNHTATGQCLGVDGVTVLAGLDLSGTTHSAVGTYTDPWSFTDVTGNYINQPGTVSDTILLVGASLKVTKTTSTTAVHVGDAFAYTIKVKNTAAIASGTFTVTDVLPPEVTFASFGGPSASDCTESSGTIVCTRTGGISALGSVSWIVNVGAFMTGAPINTATIAVTAPDTNVTDAGANSVQVQITPNEMTASVYTGDPDWTELASTASTRCSRRAGPGQARHTR